MFFLLLLHHLLLLPTKFFSRQMFRFISFGSGSSGNCYYLCTEHDALLIDAGVGIRTLKKNFSIYGLSIQSVHHIVITHDHADHIKSVGSLSHDLHVPVYATALVHHGIDRNYSVRHKIDRADVHYIEKGKRYELGDFTVTPFEVPHDSSDCVGYRVEHDGVVFCLITDVGSVTDEIRRQISDAHYLVIEANHELERLMSGPYPKKLKDRISGERGHMANHTCGEVLAECATPQLREVWLCHLSDENNHPELARLTVTGVLNAHGIVPGVDFQMEVLKRGKPMGPYELTLE